MRALCQMRVLVGVLTLCALWLGQAVGQPRGEGRRVQPILEITLPAGETQTKEATLYQCGSVTCAEPEGFERHTIGDDGQVQISTVAGDAIRVPSRWQFKTYAGVEFVYWVELPGYWSPRILVVADNAIFKLPLYRIGVVVWSSTESPATVSIRIQPSPGPDARDEVEIPCTSKTPPTFHCSLPEGRFRLRVVEDGRAVATFPSVTIEAGQLRDLSTLQPQP